MTRANMPILVALYVLSLSILGFLGLCVVGVIRPLSALGGPPPQKEKTGTTGIPAGTSEDLMDAEFWAAVGNEGSVYCRFRDRILQRGKHILPFLEERANKGATWQERTTAWILMERLAKADEIASVVQWWRTVRAPEAFWRRREVLSKGLAEKARQTPMVLIERIWKGNEMIRADIGPGSTEDRAYEALALGLLGEKRAVEPLIWLLNSDCPVASPPEYINTAALALGHLGDPRAVETLCRTLVRFRGNVVSAGAFESIERCLTSIEAIQVLDAFFANRVEEESLRKRIKAMAERKLADLGAKPR
ncbi:MAG TPA: hypothetical protein PLE19_13010 [Planctomycetota bacterium]|nr:hypothetical protein [Planctomycetota bacterium]HRR80729.1 hypothetical protein [Planctomycetota bacterium]HRT96034.1 hypothetical protein [Planctomycetota bacterium]